MAERITIEIPKELSTLLKRVVAASGESRELVAQDWFVHSVPELKTFDVDKYIQELENYGLIRLWTLVERSLERLVQVDQEMKILIDKDKQGIELSEVEQSELNALSDNYNELILLRTEALVELQERGYDVQTYLKANAPKP